MQVVTAAIKEDAILIYERTGKVLVVRDGTVIDEMLADKLSAILYPV